MATPVTKVSQMNWLSKTPSERELDRLQKVYGQLKTNNEDATPIWRTSVRLSCSAANRIASSRCNISRVLGNQYSKQNMAAGAVATPNPENVVEKTPLVLKGRSYGNQRSLQNVQTIQAQRQQQQQHCDSSLSFISNTPTSFGNYYNLKNRLILLDEQRAPLMQLYGRDRFLNEYTDLLQQCWHFEQQHKSVLPFAQVKIQEMLAEMKKCAVSNVVEQKRSAVKKPATPIVKVVDRRNASKISSTKNSTKSPEGASTKSFVTKPSGKIILKTIKQSVRSAINTDQPSPGSVKRKTCSNLIGLDKTVTTQKSCQIRSNLHCQIGAAGGLMLTNSDDGQLSNYSLDALHQEPSVFERETNLLALSSDIFLPEKTFTESERIALESVMSSVNQSEFLSTEKQKLETDPTIMTFSKSNTQNDEYFQNYQQEQLPVIDDSHCFDIAPKDQDCNIAATGSHINRSVVHQAGEPDKDYPNQVKVLVAEKQVDNPEGEADIVTDLETLNSTVENPAVIQSYPDNLSVKSTSLVQAHSLVADKHLVSPKREGDVVTDPGTCPNPNPNNLSARSTSFVRSLVNQFSNIILDASES